MPGVKESAGPDETASARRQLQVVLRRARCRARQVLAASWAVRLAPPVVGGLVLVALLLKLLGCGYHPLYPLALVAGLCSGCALIAALWPLPDRMMLASLDRRLELKDRLTTAGWLLSREHRFGMNAVALQEGLALAQSVRPAVAYAFPPARRWRAAGLGLAALLTVILVPIPPLLLSSRERQERAELSAQAARIEPLATALAQAAREGQNPEARRVARRLMRLHRDMLQGRLARKQALLRMSDLRRDLQHLQGQAEASKRGPEAAEKLNRDTAARLARMASQAAQEARKQGNSALAQKLERAAAQALRNPQTAALRQTQRDLQAAAGSGLKLPENLDLPLDLAEALQQPTPQGTAQQLQQLSQKAAAQMGNMTPGQRAALARELQRLAQTMQQAGEPSSAARLGQAARALRAGDCQGAKQAMLAQGSEGAQRAALAAAARAASRGMAGALACVAGSSCTSGSGSGASEGRGLPGAQKSIPQDASGTSLYASRQTNLRATPQPVRGALGNLQQGVIVGQVRGAPDQLPASRVPYYEVVGGYSHAAEEALRREEVPPAYRATVRDYFKALQGKKRPAASGAGPAAQEEVP